MTRQHGAQFYCPNCRTWHTAESAFGRWIRENTELDSQLGFFVMDQDYWIHRYKIFENREFQCLMAVEIKTHGAKPSVYQLDTIHVINQLLRNRRRTPTKDDNSSRSSAQDVYSIANKRNVSLKAFGAFVLTFSGLGPYDSDVITWSGGDGRMKHEGKPKVIDLDDLTALLRFDIDPDTFRPIDLRNHHPKPSKKVMSLFPPGHESAA